MGEKVRMANLIVVAEAQDVLIYDRAKSTSDWPKSPVLEDGQVFEVRIKVIEILEHRGRLAGSIIREEGLRDFHFGLRGDSVAEAKKMLLGKRLIYFLSQDYEIPFRPGYFPFHGRANMTADVGQLEKVKSLIQKFGEITREH
jgi:hypothetical protein